MQSRDSLVIQLNAFETKLVKSKFGSILIGNQVTHMSEKFSAVEEIGSLK